MISKESVNRQEGLERSSVLRQELLRSIVWGVIWEIIKGGRKIKTGAPLMGQRPAPGGPKERREAMGTRLPNVPTSNICARSPYGSSPYF